MKELFTRALEELAQGRSVMLVTLIEDRGSSPRGAGAQMLVGQGGWLCGSIGGGAVEKRSEELARTLLPEARSAVHEFSLHGSGREDIGMVCGGDVCVQFQPLVPGDSVWRAVLNEVLRRLTVHQDGWLLLPEDGGAPALADLQGTLAGIENPDPALLCQSMPLRKDGFFSLPLPVERRVLIFGAGHIAQALCPLLRSVEFRPVVFDCRPEFAVPERFPTAEAVLCGDYSNFSDILPVTQRDFVAVLTNGHLYDAVVEEQILRGPYAYLGVIGSRAKTASINRRLRERGISDALLETVHTPIGTAIKAVTPAELAVSIAGEMIRVRSELREPGKLQGH